jgi:hypothetical protein
MMELAILNDQFQASKLVEGHKSLIWTERFGSFGDFERTSEDVGGTLEALPLYTEVGGVQKPTLLTLRNSTVPMVLETHKIEKRPESAPLITSVGRSFETVLDRRTTVKTPPGGGNPILPWTSVQKTAVDAAYDVIYKIVVQGTASLADIIPEIELKTPIRPAGYVAPTADQNYQVDPGELYAWVMGQLQADKYGLRAVRPPDLSKTKISIEMYTGEDRTQKVVFDARFDQFDNTTYLLSQAGWKNVDQVTGAADSLEVVADGNTYSGLNRRVTYLDGKQIATGAPSSTLTNMLTTLGKVDLAKQLETALFSGEVSRQMGALYGKDYFLGDVVKLTGNYGLSQFVRISEFIRSEDAGGEKAYPTFESL